MDQYVIQSGVRKAHLPQCGQKKGTQTRASPTSKRVNYLESLQCFRSLGLPPDDVQDTIDQLSP